MSEIKIHKVIIVDDHEYFRLGFQMALDKIPYVKVVGEASNGQEFLDLLEKQNADIVFMDVNMHIMDGIEATQKAFKRYPNLKIIALTGIEDHYEDMTNAGACGFITKDIKFDKLEIALKTIINGNAYYSENIIDYLIQRQQFNKNVVDFTKREIEIMQLIADGLNSNKIADKLFISPRTVHNHRANMHEKAGTSSTVALLSYAIKHKVIARKLK